jgi:hypothetical protein
MMKTKLFNERGQALILIALAAIGLFAIAGLAIDGSVKYADRRHAQNAADAAALAGALAKAENPPDPLWNILALDRALANGYDDNHVTNEVWVYTCDAKPDTSPGDCGHYDGNPNYVQVVIVSNVDTYFARVLGINRTVNSVQAVALAKKGGVLGDGAMIISYDPDPSCGGGLGSGGGSVDVSGSSTLYLNGGGIFLNSDETCGYNAPNCPDINITGGAGINSVAVSPVDNVDQKEGSCPLPPVPENFNVDPIIIPDEVEWPNVPPECAMGGAPAPVPLGTAPDGKQEYLIKPGFYTDFPQANIVPNSKHIYLASGVYCIDPPMNQDLSWNSVSFVSLNASTDPSKNPYYFHNPDGVTLYIRSGGGFKFNINSPIYLDATTSTTSDYQGYLVILEGTHTSIESCEIEGGAYLDINGMIFAPYCDITVNGQSAPTADINAQIIGWDIKITGNNIINFNYDPSNAVKKKRQVGLMK